MISLSQKQLMKLFLAFTGIFLCLQLPAQEQHDSDSAIFYSSAGQSSRALPFAKRSFEAVKSISNNDSNYIAAACRLADIYVGMVKLDSALVYYINAAEGAKKLYGDSSAQYGYHLVNVATMHRNLGQYQQAKERFQDATAILEKMDSVHSKEDYSYYKKNYNNYLIAYAAFYMTTGNLNKAEELCLQACEIALTTPVDMDAYASALERLARLYGKMGFFTKQDTMLVRLYEIRKKIFGKKNPSYASDIGGLADIYQRNRKLDKADSTFRKALEIQEQFTGKNSAATIPILNRLGIVNIEMRKYKVAERYLQEAAEIIRANGGEAFALYPYCMKNLARLYVLTGRKEVAEPLFQKCLAIYNKLGMALHSDRLDLLHDMAGLLYADDPAKATIYLQEVMIAENKLLLEKLDFLSETELRAYLKANKDATDGPYRFLLNHKNPEIAGAVYNSRLLTSGISLQNTRVLYKNMAQSKDSELAVLWKNYIQQKTFYTNLLLTPAAQRNINTDSVAAMLNQQEKDILRRSADYRNMKERLAITWQDVQKHLRPGEATVEFVKFTGKQNVYANANTNTVYYGALLLRPHDTAPLFVVLCEEKQLIAAIKKFPYKAFVNSRGDYLAQYRQGVTNILYHLVWQPLEPYLAHTKTVYFSPAGMLHRVAFAAIPNRKNELLCDKFDLVQLTSTRQVALQETRLPAPVSIAMFGGINYNYQSADTALGIYNHVYRGNRGAGIDSFPFLPNTLKEINTIKTDAEASHKRSVIFTGSDATEAAFRSLDGDNSPEVIHFATHGFALPDTVQGGGTGASFKASDNPLLRCGLVMAGGNNGWKGNARPGEDDGILTGLEISAVQLTHTQLAVLSACETGLGKIEGSEGVFGLQRAFKLAGVNYIMASLWQVPDKETAEFMEIFYAHWLNGKTIREAFFTTQQIMRKKYAPYYWAGFTLVQ
jgi:CHAT domain-containing protein/tetratricopeptide (TPR) repeat protein